MPAFQVQLFFCEVNNLPNLISVFVWAMWWQMNCTSSCFSCSTRRLVVRWHQLDLTISVLSGTKPLQETSFKKCFLRPWPLTVRISPECWKQSLVIITSLVIYCLFPFSAAPGLCLLCVQVAQINDSFSCFFLKPCFHFKALEKLKFRRQWWMSAPDVNISTPVTFTS